MSIRSILVLFTAGVLASAAPAGPAPVVKQPAGVFDLAKSLPPGVGSQVVMQRFRANERGLYFYLTSSPRMAGGLILETDLKGNVQRTVALRSHLDVLDFDAEASGALAVLALDGGPRLLTYDADGQPAGSLPAPNVRGVCKAGGAALGASMAADGAALVGLAGGPHASVPVLLQDGRRRPILLCDPAGRAVWIERSTALIHVIEPAGDVVRSPQAPEMIWPRSAGRDVVFSSAALCPEGGVYIALGHSKLAEGAVVLHVDLRGNVVETIRLALPRSPEFADAENPDWFMPPGEIGAAGPWLFLTSGDGRGKVAYYQR